MKTNIEKVIATLFHALFFFTPIIFFSGTNEIFEFNKIVFVYIIATITTGLWIIRSIIHKKILFRRTILDIPLVLFLVTQTISTLVSVDTHTSLLGYYGRFNGGLLSSIAYSLLYWSYVANMDFGKTMKSLKMLLAAGLVVAIIAFLEHFGVSLSCIVVTTIDTPFLEASPLRSLALVQQTFDPSCWAQDFQTRVFSTLGQPNWLAAWIVAILPLTWSLVIREKIKQGKSKLGNKSLLIKLGLPILFFAVLLFTKSRSGMLGLAVASIIFWIGTFVGNSKSKLSSQNRLRKKHIISSFLILNSLFFILFFSIDTPLRTSVLSRVSTSQPVESSASQTLTPNSTIVITDSLTIRKSVWKGAINIWRSNPVLGTGVETFAFVFSKYKPPEHNLSSEWNFLYNKAHNEYLNILSTAGSVGFIAYSILVIAILFSFTKMKNEKLNIALLAGFVSILVTNFYGFSVVAISLLFFLFPAMAITISQDEKVEKLKTAKPSVTRSVLVVLTIFLTSYISLLITKYWYSDYIFVKAKNEKDLGNLFESRVTNDRAIKLNPYEPVYWSEMASTSSLVAVNYSESQNASLASTLETSAIGESQTAIKLSPNSPTYRSRQASMYITLAGIDPSYLFSAKDSLTKAVQLAPKDVELLYNLGLAQVRTGESEVAINTFRQAIEMKSNYKEPRLALSLLLIEAGELEEARQQLMFIVDNIDPFDQLVNQTLYELTQ